MGCSGSCFEDNGVVLFQERGGCGGFSELWPKQTTKRKSNSVLGVTEGCSAENKSTRRLQKKIRCSSPKRYPGKS